MTAAHEPSGGVGPEGASRLDPDPPDAGAAPTPPAEDPNRQAISAAGLRPETGAWLHQVADQVDPRLDRLNPRWREGAEADAARACAFGLLLAHLARLYPHMREELARTIEAHPSYTTFLAGRRMEILEQIAATPERMVAWIGPLIGVSEPAAAAQLFD